MNDYILTKIEVDILKKIEEQGYSCVTTDFLHGAIKVHGDYIDYAELNATLTRLTDAGLLTNTDLHGDENYKQTEKCRQIILARKEARKERWRSFWIGFVSGALSTAVGGWLLSLLVH